MLWGFFPYFVNQVSEKSIFYCSPCPLYFEIYAYQLLLYERGFSCSPGLACLEVRNNLFLLIFPEVIPESL